MRDIYPGVLLLALVEPLQTDDPLCDVDGCGFRAAFGRGGKRVCGQHAVMGGE